MANIFFDIVVPTADGPGPAVSISGMGFTKLFSMTGSFVATVNIEISNDGVTWASIASVNGATDIEIEFAAMFVRANVAGYVSGIPDLSVGSNTAGTASFGITVPPGNGAGAPTNVSTLGQKKTFLYSGGMVATLSVEVSQDGVTFSPAASFSGETPAFINIDGAVQLARVVVGGFVSGSAEISLAAANDSGGGGGGSSSLVGFWGNINIGTLAGTRFMTPGYDTGAAGVADDKRIGPGEAGTADFIMEVTHNIPDSSPSIVTYSLLINGVASGLSLAISATTPLDNSAAATLTIDATDRLSLQADLAGALADGGNMNVTVVVRGAAVIPV